MSKHPASAQGPWPSGLGLVGFQGGQTPRAPALGTAVPSGGICRLSTPGLLDQPAFPCKRSGLVRRARSSCREGLCSQQRLCHYNSLSSKNVQVLFSNENKKVLVGELERDYVRL